jgi:magnesium transporter
MENRNEVVEVTEAIRERIAAGDWSAVPEQLEQLHVQDIAEFLMELETEEVARVFRGAPRTRWAPIFSYLDTNYQEELLREVTDEEARFILSHLLPDDRTALLEELPDELQQRLLRLLDPSLARQATELLHYPEDSIGRLMTPRFISLRPKWTISQALDHIRRESTRSETINVVFVTDAAGRLRGAISLRELVLAEPTDRIEEVMKDYVVSVQASKDREEAVHLIQHYDLEVLPVIDERNVLLGMVTVDDVLDVAEEEVTEDFHKMGSVGFVNLSLRDARPSLLYRKRVGWLIMLVFINIFAGASLAYFETTIEAVIALVFFLPLIIDSGGNAGAQAATLMVRSLATGDVRMRDWTQMLGKELGVAIALGVTMGAAVWALGLWRGGAEVGTVVAISMVLVVVMGSLVGMSLPFLLSRYNLDPATASAPLITSIADIGGILIYFSVATALLTIPAG